MAAKQEAVSVRPLGDSALVIQLDKSISPIIHNKIINIVDLLESDPFEGFIEAVPSYNNVTIFYDPVIVHLNNQKNVQKTSFEIVCASMMNYVKRSDSKLPIKNRLVEIPVTYGGQFGPDLEYVAKTNNITPEKVIELHTKKDYLVYMIGFAPGFPYLAGINKKITTPRKKKPRQKIPAGSVGIAGEQTGIYPLETPGGWQVIGRTPVVLFNPKSSPPSLLKSGDEIRFVPITEDEYISYKEKK